MAKQVRHITWGIGLALVLTAGAARAEDSPAGRAAGKEAVSKEESQKLERQRLAAAHEAFEKERARIRETPAAPPLFRADLNGPTRQIQGRIEDVVDGVVLVSMPLTSDQKAKLVNAKALVAKTRKQVRDGAIFEDRVYRSIRIAGDSKPFEALRGKDASLTMQAMGEHGLAATGARQAR